MMKVITNEQRLLISRNYSKMTDKELSEITGLAQDEVFRAAQNMRRRRLLSAHKSRLCLHAIKIND